MNGLFYEGIYKEDPGKKGIDSVNRTDVPDGEGTSPTTYNIRTAWKINSGNVPINVEKMGNLVRTVNQVVSNILVYRIDNADDTYEKRKQVDFLNYLKRKILDSTAVPVTVIDEKENQVPNRVGSKDRVSDGEEAVNNVGKLIDLKLYGTL